MDLPDDTYLGEPDADVEAAAMREILGRDLEENELAELVLNFEHGSHEMQLAAWLMLTTKEQYEWKRWRQFAAMNRKTRYWEMMVKPNVDV